MIDLDRYFARIGYSGPAQVDLDTLNAVMQAQAQSVPFENLDVLLRRPIELSLDALERKIVTEHRGGYCFEQNGLLLHVLRAIGFQVTPLSARVRYQRPRDYTPARTHLFLSVQIDGTPWVADVGVGSMSLTSAFRLDLDGEQPTNRDASCGKARAVFIKFDSVMTGTMCSNSPARRCPRSIASWPTGSRARTRSRTFAIA